MKHKQATEKQAGRDENWVSRQDSADGKRVYTPPRLTAHGDVRDLTLGGTQVVGDSPTAMQNM